MTSATPITPPQFTALMSQMISTAPDQREIIGGGVGIMFETLNRLGYGEGLALWERVTRPKA